jgi:hypothetical protein
MKKIKQKNWYLKKIKENALIIQKTLNDDHVRLTKLCYLQEQLITRLELELKTIDYAGSFRTFIIEDLKAKIKELK